MHNVLVLILASCFYLSLACFNGSEINCEKNPTVAEQMKRMGKETTFHCLMWRQLPVLCGWPFSYISLNCEIRQNKASKGQEKKLRIGQ